MIDKKAIEQTFQQQLEQRSSVTLFAPCMIGEGILSFDEHDKKHIIEEFQQENIPTTFFIPASGSGSRMFDFLLQNIRETKQANIGLIERFMNHLTEFAFYHLFPNKIKEKIRNNTADSEDISRFILHEEGLNFAQLPKGLIPFHYNEPFVLNPFQEHVLQGSKLSEGQVHFHFTIQDQFYAKIKQSIANVEGLTGRHYSVSYSTQDKELDAFTFSEHGELVLQNGQPIRRPAGHGVLLSNLNKIDTPLIFIKNIDNVQHFSCSEHTAKTWTFLGGILMRFKRELTDLFNQPQKNRLIELNQQYQFLSPSELVSIQDIDQLRKIINRPIRVCGVVKNDGQSGGGPFWVEQNGRISKQIMEKAQIIHDAHQIRLMIKSTHFNPVMIALSPYDLEGKKHDLQQFCDPSTYFVVHKMENGQQVQYIEQPGLWNGGMANWNTLFVEIPHIVFSPVKNVLDLLSVQHQMSKPKTNNG